jgi:hypothetical protein
MSFNIGDEMNENYLEGVDYESSTTVMIKNAYGEYSVTIPRSDLVFSDLIDYGIIPVLRAVGYADQTIKDIIDSEMV